MKICFIWVREFRQFKNLGMNLSSTEKFTFDHINKTLSLSKKIPPKENFFGEGVVDVTALVGKNGSGKSNALVLLARIIAAPHEVGSDFLYVSEQNGTFVCHTSFKDHMELAIPAGMLRERSVPSGFKTIYFSNIPRERGNYLGKNVVDLSPFVGTPYLSNKRTTDFRRQLQFISSEIFQLVNIDLPSGIRFIQNAIRRSSRRHMLGKDERDLFDFLQKRLLERENRQAQLEHHIKLGFVFDLLANIREIDSENGKNPQKFRKSIGSRIRSFFESPVSTREILEDLIEVIQKFDTEIDEARRSVANSETRVSEIQISTRDQINFLKNDLALLIGAATKIDYLSEGRGLRRDESFVLTISAKDHSKILSTYLELFSDSAYFIVEWVGISSGQKAYINMFASLYYALKKTKASNVILCIDEGDTYLHPKWQVEFFSRLLETVQIVFRGKVQFVLTSHSPFLVSDLPNENITLLDTSVPESARDAIDLPIQTFGGNLYELYQFPFFLDRMRTSQFAYNTIRAVAEYIESKKYKEEEKEDLQRFVASIGDQLVRFRLNERLNENKEINDYDPRTSRL